MEWLGIARVKPVTIKNAPNNNKEIQFFVYRAFDSISRFTYIAFIIAGGVVPLLHCDICPASYHMSCLPPSARASCTTGVPWTCPSCKSGHKPLYGDIVWVKYSNYRLYSFDITAKNYYCYYFRFFFNQRFFPELLQVFRILGNCWKELFTCRMPFFCCQTSSSRALKCWWKLLRCQKTQLRTQALLVCTCWSFRYCCEASQACRVWE